VPKKKNFDYGTGIPRHEVEALAYILYKDILEFFENADNQREFAEWLLLQEEKEKDK
jgi:hypothetical protein